MSHRANWRRPAAVVALAATAFGALLGGCGGGTEPVPTPAAAGAPADFAVFSDEAARTRLDTTFRRALHDHRLLADRAGVRYVAARSDEGELCLALRAAPDPAAGRPAPAYGLFCQAAEAFATRALAYSFRVAGRPEAFEGWLVPDTRSMCLAGAGWLTSLAPNLAAPSGPRPAGASACPGFTLPELPSGSLVIDPTVVPRTTRTSPPR